MRSTGFAVVAVIMVVIAIIIAVTVAQSNPICLLTEDPILCAILTEEK